MHKQNGNRPLSRKRVLAALALGLTSAGLMMMPTLLVARDETATHAQLHVGSSAAVMTIAAIVALVWRTTRRRSESLARTALLSTLSLLAVSQLTESGGAYAWKSDGVTLQSPTLHVVHTAATLTGAVALFAVAAAAVAALATLALRVAPLLRAGTTMLLLALALGVATGSATASSIVYVKSHSIWVVTPNGKHPTKLSSGGRKFASPSQADNGTVVALSDDNHLYRFSRAAGNSASRSLPGWDSAAARASPAPTASASLPTAPRSRSPFSTRRVSTRSPAPPGSKASRATPMSIATRRPPCSASSRAGTTRPGSTTGTR